MGTGTLRPRSAAWASMAVICCLFPSTRKIRWRTCCGSRRPASSNADAIMSSMDSVMEADTHLSRAFGPGCAWRRAWGAAMSPGSRAAGVRAGGGVVGRGRGVCPSFLSARGRVFSFLLAGVPAVLRAHGDALAVALHHDHVAAGLLFFFRVAGAPGVEVARPGGEVFREAGKLGAADLHAGAGLDDLLGLPEPARGQVEGPQFPHPQGVRVAGQDLRGVGGG